MLPVLTTGRNPELGSSKLVLPGERGGLPVFRLSRVFLAALIGFVWLPIQASVVPELGIGALPVDPILPLVAAFALGGRTGEAWLLAMGMGYLADFYSGAPPGRLMLQYGVVITMSAPLRGRIVLRDRLVPVVGIAAMTFASSLVVAIAFGAMGALVPGELTSLPLECAGTSLAAWILWPMLGHIGGLEDEPRLRRL